ncbi:AI-2E family transporter [Parerythrobacter lacustris]|uniref:AI-2E family transporter n=1 Tax=Parerythrobacter lacustris TaxID=2969984 RepID=A0ABT1XTT0_9SPHN|nr:AI-2E family transporter [Parerythrobacter lacustris]MCR2834659.1 AI-2E family transporter [Parerythrobacter lacustris]
MNNLPHEPSAAAQLTSQAENMQTSDPAPVARSTLIVLAIVGCAWLLVELHRFFLLVFAAIVLGAVFDAISGRICRWTGIARPYGLSLAIIAFLAVFAGAFTLFGAQLAGEFDTIRQTVPAAVEGIQAFLDRYGLGAAISDLAKMGSDDLSRLFTQAGGIAIAAGNGIADFVLVLVGAIFMAANPGVYRRGFLLLVPEKAQATAAQALDDSGKGLRGWMMGQAISSLLVAALTWIGLWLLGVPAAGGLGVIAGLLDIIPMVGPIIAGVPAVLLAFTVSPLTALWTLLLFLAIQQLQGNFLQPMIQKQAVDIPPALLLFAVLAFGLLFGFLGVLLAAPLTIVSYILVRRVYVEAILGKPISVADAD